MPQIPSDHAFRQIVFIIPPPQSPSVNYVLLSIHSYCLSLTISQYLFVRFNAISIKMISTIDSQYPKSFVKIDHLTLSYCP